VDVLGVKDCAHAQGVADGAFFVFTFHAVFVVGLRDDDADDEGVIVVVGDERGAAAVSGKGGEIGEEGGMGLEGEEGRAGEYSLASHGEAGGVGLEALGISENEEGAADVNPGGFELWFRGEEGGREGLDADGKGLGDAKHGNVLIFVANP
jgi:hypothetical protein